MRLLLSFIFCLSFVGQIFGQKDHWVNPHFRKNGSFVEGHYRTNRNNTPWDNYSTIGNYNPYTGKAGWIYPKIPSYGYTTPSYDWYAYSEYIPNWYSYGKKRISIYTNFGMASKIKVFINNQFAGTTQLNFPGGSPSCGQYGTMTTNCDNGVFQISAVDGYGYTWNFSLPANSECNSMALTYPENAKIHIGELSAKFRHKPEPYLFWVPCLASAIYWPLALPALVGCNYKYKELPSYEDEYYKYGYHQKAKSKNLGRTILGAGVGISINLLIILVIQSD